MPRLALVGLVPIVLASLVCPGVSGAQEAPTFTEAEYLSALEDRHPAVRASVEAVARAEAAARAATTLSNPSLAAVREDPSGPGRQTDLVVSWKVPDLARRSAIESRTREVEAAKARLEVALRAHRLAMRAAYASWAVADARRDRLVDQAERVEALARREATRTEKGEASGLEAHRLRLAASALRSRVALAEGESAQARAEAATWVSALPAEARPLLPDLPEAAHLAGPNPAVRAAEADLAAAELAREATSRFVASPEIILGWQRQEVGPESIDGPVVGLTWSVPLFDRRQASRDAAEASVDAARARLDLAERGVRAELAGADRRYAQLSAALSRARRALDESTRMLDGAEAAFRLGEATLTDLLETHRSVTEAELLALDLREAALAAARELERLAGPTGFGTIHESSDDPSRSSGQGNTP